MHIGLGGILLLGLLAILLFGSRQVLVRLAWIVGIFLTLCMVGIVIMVSHH
jgi:hypothetical protein